MKNYWTSVINIPLKLTSMLIGISSPIALLNIMSCISKLESEEIDNKNPSPDGIDKTEDDKS